MEILEIDARLAQLIAGAAIGVIFGAAAQTSRFCIRRAVSGDQGERGEAAAVWASALAAAILGFALANSAGFVDVSGHRFAANQVPLAALILGGTMFGIGMVLTRGCVSRLTVLAATGNLRAASVLVLFAVVAHATMKGVLAPVRTAISNLSVDLPFGTLAELPLGLEGLGIIVVTLAIVLIRATRPKWSNVFLGIAIGLVALGGWVLTSTLLMDEFDPLPVQSAAFTQPWADTLFWLIASTAVPAGFGVGFIGGVLAGAFFSAAARNELQLQSFGSPKETLRYGTGAVLMGIGGVLAGGCTVGAGLSGSATGSIAALIVLASVVAGGFAASRALQVGSEVPAAA